MTRCTKKVCPTNIKNSEQKRNLFFVNKRGDIGKRPYARGGRARGKKRIVKRNAIRVKSGEIYFLKKSSSGTLKVHRRAMKQYRR